MVDLVTVLHRTDEIHSYVEEEVTFPVATQLAPHSVSASAIKAKPLFVIPHFLIGVYPNCPAAMADVVIPVNDKLELGSVGMLDIHAEFNAHEIFVNSPSAVG